MSTKIIPLRELKADPEALLNNCYDSGEPLVVELQDQRLVEIRPVDDDDHLIDNLIANNPAFRAMLAKSLASGLKPFEPRHLSETSEPGS